MEASVMFRNSKKVARFDEIFLHSNGNKIFGGNLCSIL